jgi:voltage-gated sodium channel
MFARGNIAAASLAHNKINETNEKTDEELMAEIEADLAENEGLDDLDILRKEEEKYKEQFQGFWLLELFGVVCWKCHMLVHGPYAPPFNMLIMLAIVMAGILVGVETYDEYSSDPSVQALDYFVVSIFGFDVLVKIGVEGIRPWNFFFGEHGRWNTFDFFIVLICMPHISDVFGNSSATIRLVSRLFRLFRVGKIIEQIPALQVIVTGLIGGLKSILYVALLLLIIFFIWGVFGVYLFHANDPFYFRDLPTALVTLFRVCTLEGWSDVMYTNIYGCDVYDAGLYMVRSDVNSTADWHAIPNFWRCENPVAQPEISGAFFISFTLVASLVMLQLFIGVITIQMQDSLAEMRKESEAVSRKKLLMKQVREMKGMAKKEAALQIARAMISMQSSDEHEHGHGHGHGGKSNIHNQGHNEALASHLAALDYQESDSDSDSDSSGDEDESAATWLKSFLGRLWL